jgi:hypothetical protein
MFLPHCWLHKVEFKIRECICGFLSQFLLWLSSHLATFLRLPFLGLGQKNNDFFVSIERNPPSTLPKPHIVCDAPVQLHSSSGLWTVDITGAAYPFRNMQGIYSAYIFSKTVQSFQHIKISYI